MASSGLPADRITALPPTWATTSSSSKGRRTKRGPSSCIAEVKKVIPNKPIRFVVNTHVHFDHSGGLRTFVDEGATVVTHQANLAFYEKAWAAPRI